MRKRCPSCDVLYDDAERDTICPHRPLPRQVKLRNGSIRNEALARLDPEPGNPIVELL